VAQQDLRALAAPDKFRGSLSAAEVARALAEGARRAGWECRELALADGGEGTLEALGGANRSSTVTGPLGAPVEAGWRLEAGDAVIEMARASGLALVARNDPVPATTRGTGELLAAALAAGAERVVVAVGGSATTDGGVGAVEALGWEPFRSRVEVACDVRTPFLDAARVFGPQKGATPGQVVELSARLAGLATRYREELGVDVTTLAGAGAAGGLAGGLAALGATLRPGFKLVAERTGLEQAVRDVGLVLTGEGLVDATSFAGKVVGGVIALAPHAAVVAGQIASGIELSVPAISLVERFGKERAWSDAAACVADAAAYLCRLQGLEPSRSARP
jgi:glycerate kinase